jgi:hypothetical protein
MHSNSAQKRGLVAGNSSTPHSNQGVQKCPPQSEVVLEQGVEPVGLSPLAIQVAGAAEGSAPEVTEYQLRRLCCPRCGIPTCASLPAGVPAGGQGLRLQAVLALMTGAYRMSKRMMHTLYPVRLVDGVEGVRSRAGMAACGVNLPARRLAMPGSAEGVNNKALLAVNRSYGLKSGDSPVNAAGHELGWPGRPLQRRPK